MEEEYMVIKFNVNGEGRKAMVKAIEKELGCKVTKLSPAKLFNSTQELMDAVM